MNKTIEMNNKNTLVTVVGIGYVGLTLSMALTKCGFTVIGIDSDYDKVRKLREGKTEILEKGINDLLESALEENLFQVFHKSEINGKISLGEIHFITVGTPIISGKIDNSYLEIATQELSKFVKEEDLVIIRSTVSLGSSREIVYKILLESKKHINLAMCPERTIEGNAIEEIFSLPQIIGGIDSKSTEMAKSFFSRFTNSTVVLNSIEEAEIVKLANNSFRDLTFAFSNELTMLCNSVGINSSKIIEAANLNYPRSFIPTAGPAGGPCLSKDSLIFAESAEQSGAKFQLVKIAREVNRNLPLNFVLGIIKKQIMVKKNPKITLMGLAFKGVPAVLDARDSFAIDVATQIYSKFGLICYGFEPAGTISLPSNSKIKVVDLHEAIYDSDCLIFCHNASFFVDYFFEYSMFIKPSCSLIDMWGQISKLEISNDLEIFAWT